LILVCDSDSSSTPFAGPTASHTPVESNAPPPRKLCRFYAQNATTYLTGANYSRNMGDGNKISWRSYDDIPEIVHTLVAQTRSPLSRCTELRITCWARGPARSRESLWVKYDPRNLLRVVPQCLQTAAIDKDLPLKSAG
jgi:hypothetical protein